MHKTLITACVAAALLAGCKAKDEAAADTAAAQSTAPAAAQTDTPAAEAAPTAATAAATVFDIGKIPVSDKPLPAWPYVVLPAGYTFAYEDIAAQSKDLAQVPMWTGGQLLWLEGRTFENSVKGMDGKTYSRFEVLKGIDQAIMALGAVKLTERSYDEATYRAEQKKIDQFRSEFNNVHAGYQYDEDASTYLIRRADKAIWFMVYGDDNGARILVAEAPLPQAPAQ